MINPNNKDGPPVEELMFEYEQLRREILQQDIQSIQVVAGVILIVSALMTIALGAAVSSLLVKGLLFLLVQVIACIGLWQTIQRAHTSLRIASYLRTFIEPNIAGLKWEIRLRNFRQRAELRFRHLRLGEFFTYLLIYIFLIIINFLLGAGYVLYELHVSPFLTIALVLIVCIGAITIWFLWISLRILRQYTANSGETFDALWKEVKEEAEHV